MKADKWLYDGAIWDGEGLLCSWIISIKVCEVRDGRAACVCPAHRLLLAVSVVNIPLSTAAVATGEMQWLGLTSVPQLATSHDSRAPEEEPLLSSTSQQMTGEGTAMPVWLCQLGVVWWKWWDLNETNLHLNFFSYDSVYQRWIFQCWMLSSFQKFQMSIHN